MTSFAVKLVEAGIDAQGIVQLPPDAEGCGPGALMKLHDVATGEVTPLCQNLGPGAGSCRLDASALAGAAERLRAAAKRPCDILFFSKFGNQEASGGRMRAELAFAITEGRTVLTAVKRSLLSDWHRFTGGQGALLDARPWVVRSWQDVSPLGRSAAWARPTSAMHYKFGLTIWPTFPARVRLAARCERINACRSGSVPEELPPSLISNQFEVAGRRLRFLIPST